MRSKGLAPDGLLKSGLKLIGGKTGQTKISGRVRMYACEPEGMTTYVEPFLGSANVLVGKNNHQLEVVGDVNEYMIAFFKCMQECPMDLFYHLIRQVRKIEEGEAEYFHEIRKRPPETGSLEWASWYYIINKYSFNGIVRFNEKGECNSTYCTTTKGRGIYDREWFDKVVDRIKDVKFVLSDYSQLLKWANGESRALGYRTPDSEKTWVVLDPPYYEVFTKYNRVSFSPEDHRLMRDQLQGAKYKWLLTINDHPEVRKLYADFNFIEHEIFYSCSQTAAGRGNNKELIVTNYPVCKSNIQKLFSPASDNSSKPTTELSPSTVV